MSAKVTPLSQQLTLVSGQVSGITGATNTRGVVLTGLDLFVDLVVLINVTAGGTATGAMNLYVQDSWDGGTTWDDLISSNAFALGGAVITQRFVISGRIDTTATQGSAVSVEALTAGTVRKGAWGNQIRLREKISGPSGSPVGATYSVTVVAKR